MNISKSRLNIVLDDICMRINCWKLVGVINITVKNTLKSTNACAVSEIAPYFEWVTCRNIESKETCFVCHLVYFRYCIYSVNMQK